MPIRRSIGAAIPSGANKGTMSQGLKSRMKKIWLVSHYAMPPQYEVRIKTLKYAEYLQRMGHEVLLITASTIHNTDINLITSDAAYVRADYGDLHYVHIKCPGYKGNGVKRVVNMLAFERGFSRVMRTFDRPDVIVADVNCINYGGIMRFARKHGVKFIPEIRDLWPMSIVEYAAYSERNPIIQFLYRREKRMYRLADGIVFSIEGGKQYIVDKGWDKAVDLAKCFYINNGVDFEKLDEQRRTCVLSDPQLDDVSLFKLVYVGAIRQANNLGIIVEAASLLKNSPGLCFVLFGDGDERAGLQQFCREHGLSNVHFQGVVDKAYIPGILSRADVNLLNYRQAKTLRYGGSQNKLFDYMASGKPVISTVTMGYSLIERSGCGITLEKNTPEHLCDAIKTMRTLSSKEITEMGARGTELAKEFDYRILTERLMYAIEMVCDGVSDREYKVYDGERLVPARLHCD